MICQLTVQFITIRKTVLFNVNGTTQYHIILKDKSDNIKKSNFIQIIYYMGVSKNPIYGVVIIKYKKLFENNKSL